MQNRRVKEVRPYESPATVGPGATIREMAETFVQAPMLHHLCVVDEAGRLKGLVNRKRLFRNIFLHQVRSDSRVSELLRLMTAETAADMMISNFIAARESDRVGDVLGKIIAHHIREVPVIDDAGRVLGFLTLIRLIDLWLRGESSS